MFFSLFGGAWMALWCLNAYGVRISVLLLVAGITISLFLLSYRQFRQNRIAYAAEADSPESKKAGRAFNIVNATQWVLIFLVATSLSKFEHKEWIIPSIIFIVGVHFFPLAVVFKVPRHHVTGAAMTLLAIVYPLIAKSGPASPIGCLGAGIILWASSGAALMPNPPLNLDPA
jgi:uncharacterized membrane protein YecN with MAPEG domain